MWHVAVHILPCRALWLSSRFPAVVKGTAVQVNPLGRLAVQGGSLWQIQNVEVSMLSFDWFVPKAVGPSPRPESGHLPTVEPVRVEIVNSSLQCPKCASNYEDGMGSSWVQVLGGLVEAVCPLTSSLRAGRLP